MVELVLDDNGDPAPDDAEVDEDSCSLCHKHFWATADDEPQRHFYPKVEGPICTVCYDKLPG